MTNAKSVSIIIPAFNEEKGLGKVLDQLEAVSKDNHWEVIVVDDCSTDGTCEVANRFGIKLLRQPYNKGYGAALKKGIREATSDILVFMDGDAQHDPKDIPRFLEEMSEYDMVVGFRDKRSSQDWIRKPGKWVLGKVANYLSGRKIMDVNCGFRAVKKYCAEEFMVLYPNGFSISTTLTMAMIKAGYSVKYIPIKTHKREGRGSTVKQSVDGSKTLLLILRCIILFNPLKVFIPLSLFLFVFGSAFSIYSVITISKVSNSGIISILSSLIIFFFGLISDQLSLMRRSPK